MPLTTYTAGEVLTAASLNANLVFAAANPTAPTIAIFNETQAAGTDGGLGTAAAWTKRTLNTTVVNNISGCSIASSVITLATAGTYMAEIASPFFSVNRAKGRLRNTTASTNAVIGKSVYVDAVNGGDESSMGVATFTITASTTFELQYYYQTASGATSLGISYAAQGISEIWGVVKITRIA